MKTLSELTDFYYKTLYPSLKKLDDDRKKLKSKIINIAIFFTFVMVFIVLLLKDIFFNTPELLIFVTVVYIILGSVVFKYLIKDYRKEFKQKIMRPLISAIDNNLNYLCESHVSRKIVERADIFSKIDRLSGNDYVTGKIDHINIEFSDIHAEKRHKDSKGREQWTTVFQGLFIMAEFHKDFNGKTIILPDTAQSSFGNLIGGWLQSNNFARDELIKMDDIEFEKEFVVYGSDQIEARYILSPNLMKKILTLKKRSKHPLYISFVRSHIHIAIEYNKDLFEPSVFHSLLEYKIAMEYIDTLHLSLGIVKELKLNEKLWSKK